MITLPYLLVLNVPLHHHAGRYWADPLWRKDLEAHLVEISDLSIACPVVRGAPPPEWQPVAAAITVHPLPAMTRSALLLAPIIARRLWRAMTAADIVHTGVAGWPFPLGWLAIPIARLRRRGLVVVVESAFWRIAGGAPASRPARARALLWERLNRRAVGACDVSFFTTHAYRDELHAGSAGSAHVLPAVWIDADRLIERDRLAALAPARRGRLLFAGRLTRAKGVTLLLRAIERSGVAVDFVGEGPLREAVLAAAARLPALVRLIEPVDYGPAFVELLDGYAALVVPTISDEQPRVVFDAFARGLAVLASATGGNRQVVDDGHNGVVFAVDDAAALAAVLARAAAAPDRLAAMGVAARAAMNGRTHAAMHAERARAIAAAFARRPPRNP